jgi:hypothetical protein
MPIQADDVETLHRYAEGVMARVEHHAGNVGAIALALLGAIIWRAEPGSLQIRPYGGGMGNVLSFRIGPRAFAFRYEHSTQEIELRENNIAGPVLRTFSNLTPVTDVQDTFRNL